MVTGNLRHFPRFWKKTKIITPGEFIPNSAIGSGTILGTDWRMKAGSNPFRCASRLVREYLSAILAGLADHAIQRLPDLTPAAWFAQHS